MSLRNTFGRKSTRTEELCGAQSLSHQSISSYVTSCQFWDLQLAPAQLSGDQCIGCVQGLKDTAQKSLSFDSAEPSSEFRWQQENKELKPAPGQTPGAYFSFYQRPLPLKLSKAGRCSTRTFESQGHLESTSVAEGRNSWVSAARWSKETPRGLKYVLKSRPQIPVLRGSICQGHRGQEQQMFLVLLWDLRVLLSLLPSKILTLLEWQESTAARCPVVCALDNQHRLTFSSKRCWVTLFWPSFPPAMFCQGCWHCQDCLEGADRSWASWQPSKYSEGLDTLPVPVLSCEPRHCTYPPAWLLMNSRYSEKP